MTSRRYLLATGDPGQDFHSRHHAVVVPGVSAGGPQHLQGALIDQLIDAEGAGVHTIILAGDISDLDADPAKVCRYVATDIPAVADEAKARYGTDRVLMVRSTTIADVGAWIGRLPRPEAQRLARRIRRAVRRFAPARALYTRIKAQR